MTDYVKACTGNITGKANGEKGQRFLDTMTNQTTGQHTPGPWKAQGGGIIVGHRPGSDLPLAVADIFLPIHNGKEYEMQRANALLIAAAPIMETALRSVLCNLALAKKEGRDLGMYAQLAIKAAESALITATKET